MKNKTVTSARIAMAMCVLTLLSLLLLHFLSPEFEPSWRMVSEYALGNYNGVLLLMFISWALSSWALAFAVRPLLLTTGSKIGWIFLIISGIGMMMGGLFSIPHNLHGPAAALGLPSFCVAAILITVGLRKSPKGKSVFPLLTAHLPWISLALMAAAMGVMISGFITAGIDMSTGKAPERLPEGVIGAVGYVNRLLIVVYCFWTWSIARKLQDLKLSSTGT
ncbi:MAG TPA: DUF998 domain-containing protein [Flavitalea sp.]|nr:DUF998 domain-containing protein [Flavitalea sp.]